MAVGAESPRFGALRRTARLVNRQALLRIGVVAVACYAAIHAIGTFGRPYSFFDMKIYHGSVVWWTGGKELYGFVAAETTLGFTYPPFAALLMLPMAKMPLALAGWINAIASVAALALILIALLRPIASRVGWSPWFALGIALPLSVALEPARETIGYGQVNLLLFALIMADLLALRWRSRPPASGSRAANPLRRLWFSGSWAGVGIGLATSIKLTPALFILYLVVTRQWRMVVTAVGTAVTATIATFVVAERESIAYFTRVLWQTERVGASDMTPNQSLAGLLARLYDSAETPGLLYITFALLLLAVGLSRAASAHADGDELAAFTLVGLTANVISPISWSHHLVFVIPAVIILADAALRRHNASRGLQLRGLPPGINVGLSGVGGLRSPVWFPSLIGLRHAVAALGLYLLFLISPIWRYEHRLPEVSHYQDGLFGALMENSLALALIVLVAALPWRPNAEPAFSIEPAVGSFEPAAGLARRSLL